LNGTYVTGGTDTNQNSSKMKLKFQSDFG
jgi:hypothetical protein